LSSAEASYTISAPPRRSTSNGISTSNVPRSPLPAVAVTKSFSMIRPSQSVSSKMNVASYVV